MARMNWKLVKPDSEPQLDDWSDWKIMSPPVSTLDLIYKMAEQADDTEGIQKLGPGRYWVRKTWL